MKTVFRKRLYGEGVQYCNPYQRKKVGFIQSEYKNCNIFKDGYYSDGSYLIKVGKQPKTKHKYRESTLDLKKHLYEAARFAKREAEVVAEIYDCESDIKETVAACVRSKDKKTKMFFNIKFIDSILTKYPDAKMFIVTKEEYNNMLLFKVDDEPVACVMPLRDPIFSVYILKRMKGIK